MNKLRFKCKTKSLVLLHLKVFFLNAITLGLYYPFGTVRLTSFYLSKTYTDSNKRFVFIGSGKELFKKYVIWYLLALVTFGIYLMTIQSRILQYIFENMQLIEADDSKYTIKLIEPRHFMFFWYSLGQSILTGLCLGFYAPYAKLKMLDYIFNHYVDFKTLDNDIEVEKLITLIRDTEEVDKVVMKYYVYNIINVFTLGLFSFIAKKYNYINFLSLCEVIDKKYDKPLVVKTKVESKVKEDKLEPIVEDKHKEKPLEIVNIKESDLVDVDINIELGQEKLEELYKKAESKIRKNFYLDLKNMSVTISSGESVVLNDLEFALLSVLISHDNKSVTTSEIEKNIFDDCDYEKSLKVAKTCYEVNNKLNKINSSLLVCRLDSNCAYYLRFVSKI